jgi:hypothetical protein
VTTKEIATMTSDLPEFMPSALFGARFGNQQPEFGPIKERFDLVKISIQIEPVPEQA